MRRKCLLAARLLPRALAVVVLVVCAFTGQSTKAQSSQPPFPVQWQRPDQTKPLEDKSIQDTPQQHEPTAAEISKNETVASALLRSLHYQEYEVRAAAEAMPEEKYAYRPADGKLRTRSRSLVPPKCAHLQ